MSEPLRLHIGGLEPKPGWKILNIQPGPGVDFVGTATDLSALGDGSADVVYASHVYEHLNHHAEIMAALREAYRVLKPGGKLLIGVPDLKALMQLLNAPGLSADQRFNVQRMIYGGQVDEHDYHKSGYTFDILEAFLKIHKFSRITKVQEFGLFQDTTTMKYLGVRISLNVEAVK